MNDVAGDFMIGPVKTLLAGLNSGDPLVVRAAAQAIAVLAVTELETQRSPASRTRGAALRVFIVAFFLVASLALSWALLR